MLKTLKICVSRLDEGPLNLALEDDLIRSCEKDSLILYLWQNQKTIVMGRYQNPYKECNINDIKKDSIGLVRRKSGGGAVYQDLGNLNFTFISSKENHDIQKHYNVILKAIETYGLKGECSGRNDLTINGFKFSGNAFQEVEGNKCHHGTLLIDTDLSALSKYLTPSKLKIKGKSIESVKSPVVNLKNLNQLITVQDLSERIIEAVKEVYGLESETVFMTKENLKAEISEKSLVYSDWQWVYGASPSYDLYLEEKFDWGVFEVELATKNNEIVACSINSDCILNENFFVLREALIGEAIQGDSICKVIDKVLINPLVKNDLNIFFKKNI